VDTVDHRPSSNNLSFVTTPHHTPRIAGAQFLNAGAESTADNLRSRTIEVHRVLIGGEGSAVGPTTPYIDRGGSSSRQRCSAIDLYDVGGGAVGGECPSLHAHR